MKPSSIRIARPILPEPSRPLGGDEIPPGQFRGGDEIPPGQFRLSP